MRPPTRAHPTQDKGPGSEWEKAGELRGVEGTEGWSGRLPMLSETLDSCAELEQRRLSRIHQIHTLYITLLLQNCNHEFINPSHTPGQVVNFKESRIDITATYQCPEALKSGVSALAIALLVSRHRW